MPSSNCPPTAVPRNLVILADSSAWVEYDRATGSPVHRRLAELIATAGAVAVTEPVVMEVLAGARSDKREADLRRLLLRFELLRFDAATDFDGAAHIYRRCKAAGVTPRGMVDCMIAAVAWRSGAALLAFDADIDRVARVVGIKIDAASLRDEP
jgi:predicted nucleic acid-binding protein